MCAAAVAVSRCTLCGCSCSVGLRISNAVAASPNFAAALAAAAIRWMSSGYCSKPRCSICNASCGFPASLAALALRLMTTCASALGLWLAAACPWKLACCCDTTCCAGATEMVLDASCPATMVVRRMLCLLLQSGCLCPCCHCTDQHGCKVRSGMCINGNQVSSKRTY